MKPRDMKPMYGFADSATPSLPVVRTTGGSACGLATKNSSRVRGASRNGE